MPPYRKRKGKHHFSKEQVKVLDRYFRKDHYPILEKRTKIAEKVDLHQNQVSIWFQNRRKKFKEEEESLGELGSHSDSHHRKRRRFRSALETRKNFPASSSQGVAAKATTSGDDGTQEHLKTLSLPSWPSKVKYVPFQKKIFPTYSQAPCSSTDKSAKIPTTSGKKTKRATKRKCTHENSENKIEENDIAIEVEDDDLTNTQLLNNLISVIETIRKDTLYIPLMDEIYDQQDKNYIEEESPTSEKALMRSIRQCLEPNSYIQNLKL